MSDSKIVSIEGKDQSTAGNFNCTSSILITTRIFIGLSVILLGSSIVLMYNFTQGFFGWSSQHIILWGLILALLIVIGASHTKIHRNKCME